MSVRTLSLKGQQLPSCTGESPKCIDYIYVNKRTVGVRAVGLLARRIGPASDHIGVSAVLSLK